MTTTLIRSIQTTGGFLQNCRINFEAGLNCIIGARGTCKSTIVESIRFAFDARPERVSVLVGEAPPDGSPAHGMIRSTLGVGSVRVGVSVHGDTETDLLSLEREIGTSPRILRDGVREHANRAVLDHIEIFSQGDLQRIADDRNDEERLRLIDRPHAARIAHLMGARHSAASELRATGESLRDLRVRMASLHRETQPVAELRESLNSATSKSPSISPEMDAERKKFELRERTTAAISTTIEGFRTVARYLAATPKVRGYFDAAKAVVAESQHTDAERLMSSLQKRADSLRAVLALVSQLQIEELDRDFAALKQLFEEENEPFFQLRQRQQDVNEALKKEQHLRRQIEHLQRLEEELVEAKGTERELLEKRAALRADIARIDNEVFDLRSDEVKAINDEHGDIIFLTLETERGSKSYAGRIASLLKSSKIRSQDEVANGIAQAFSPADFVDLIESGNSQRLADALGRDLGQAGRVVAHLGDHAELYQLEAEASAVRLGITMYDRGEAKPVETLSKGQKATAILPLILRPLPYPLVLDQPEDDLDNSFIIKSLVVAIKNLKIKRQLIFVTHNANIPVLGDADCIAVMQMLTPTQAAAPKCGTVDECRQEVLDLLEGGARAFLERETRYGELLHVEAKEGGF